jgi:hypothetical protein
MITQMSAEEALNMAHETHPEKSAAIGDPDPSGLKGRFHCIRESG